MKLHAIPADGVGDGQLYDLKAAETFKIGAAVYLDANEDVLECGADPATILGFAASPAAPHLDADEAVQQNQIIVFKATEGQRFWMAGDNAPTADDVNQSYGIAKDGDGIWYVDGTEAVNTRVYVHSVDLQRNLYKVSVLVANRQAV